MAMIAKQFVEHETRVTCTVVITHSPLSLLLSSQERIQRSICGNVELSSRLFYYRNNEVDGISLIRCECRDRVVSSVACDPRTSPPVISDVFHLAA